MEPVPVQQDKTFIGNTGLGFMLYAYDKTGEPVPVQKLDGRQFRERADDGTFAFEPGRHLRHASKTPVCPCCLRPIRNTTVTLPNGRVRDKRGHWLKPSGTLLPNSPHTMGLSGEVGGRIWTRDCKRYVPFVVSQSAIAAVKTAFELGFKFDEAKSICGWGGMPRGFDECLRLSASAEYPAGWKLVRYLRPYNPPGKSHNTKHFDAEQLQAIDRHLWSIGNSLRDVCAIMLTKYANGPEYRFVFSTETNFRNCLARSGYMYAWKIVPATEEWKAPYIRTIYVNAAE